MALAVCVLAGTAIAPAHSAGLLDFLFGSSGPQQAQPQPQVVPSYGGGAAPLRMRVQPRAFERRIAREGSERARKADFRKREAREPREARPRETRKREAKVALATPIDPKKNPNWFLEDTTLRKGDILVLKGQVVVFEGKRGPSSIDDFAALKDSKLVSKGERSQIEGMARLPANAPAVAVTPVAAVETPAPKVASLDTPPAR